MKHVTLPQAPTAKFVRLSPEPEIETIHLTPDLSVQHRGEVVKTIRVPGSKSLTNRALLIAAVANGRSVVDFPLMADDTGVMIDALEQLGADQQGPDGQFGFSGGYQVGYNGWLIHGLGGAPQGPHDIYCGMAGTVGRFLLPMIAAGSGDFHVDAHEQLRRRPLGPVLGALRSQGAKIQGDGFPLRLSAVGLRGGVIEVDASVSSQFLSGLLMAAPLAQAPTTLRFGRAVSAPYIGLTLDVMRAFGVNPVVREGEIEVRPSTYQAARYNVEPDVSTASYFLASATLTGKTLTLRHLRREETHQGDIELVGFLEEMGCTVGADPKQDGAIRITGPQTLRGVTVNMENSSDVFMTLACIAPFAQTPTTIEGIGHARVKESDRIAACAENLTRLGIRVEEGEDWIRVHPGNPQTAVLPTFEDHRIAMAFSLIGHRVPVILADPGCVAKTCPMFFETWRDTGAKVEFADDVSAWS